MKILHVETGRHLYGGPQQVLYLCQGLMDRGVDTRLVCPSGSAVEQAARRLGIPVTSLNCGGDLDMRFAWRLRQILVDELPDIVHCHSRRGGDFLGGQAAAMAGIPAVVSRRVDATEVAFLSALRYRPFRKVIAISDTIAEILRKTGLSANKLVVIHSAVDGDRFPGQTSPEEFRQRFHLAAGDFVIVSAAQFVERKGQRYLLRALAELESRYPQLKLVLFGQGPLEKDLRSLSTALGIDNIVQFAGFQPDLDDYLGCFDLLVHPALQEGLGVIALKAAAATVPVVAFEAGGLREVVIHQQTGLLTPPRDVPQLAAAIASLIDDARLRQRYGRMGAEHVRNNFSVPRMLAQHLVLYEGMLNG